MTVSAPAAIPLVDLKAQYEVIGPDVYRALARVVASQRFIGGEEVEGFEQEWAKFCEADYCVGVGSGTLALELALRALGVGGGDQVILPAMTFTATAEAVANVGARPVFCDVEPGTWTLEASSLSRAVTFRTAAIIPVHLYGRRADMSGVLNLAARYNLAIIEDAAQAHGLTLEPPEGIRWAAAYSFYPGKNLGAYGDAGAVLTNDADVAERVRSFADHGRSTGHKYQHEAIGTNARLDALQAAILRAKLPHLLGWVRARRRIAARYLEDLAALPALGLPLTTPGHDHAWHLFVVTHPERDALRAYLAERGISTGIHYPTPLHLQPCWSYLGYKRGDFPISERLAETCLSLPLYPELTEEQQERVIEAIRGYCDRI